MSTFFSFASGNYRIIQRQNYILQRQHSRSASAHRGLRYGMAFRDNNRFYTHFDHSKLSFPPTGRQESFHQIRIQSLYHSPKSSIHEKYRRRSPTALIRKRKRLFSFIDGSTPLRDFSTQGKQVLLVSDCFGNSPFFLICGFEKQYVSRMYWTPSSVCTLLRSFETMESLLSASSRNTASLFPLA